ncbi:TPA: hypothetical protein ACX6S1_000753 [Photobacterium damselae]
MKIKYVLMGLLMSVASAQTMAKDWTLENWYLVSFGKNAVVRSEAIQTCETLGLGGKHWRLPTQNEFDDAMDNNDMAFMNVMKAMYPSQSAGFLNDRNDRLWFFSKVTEDGNTMYPVFGGESFRGQILCTSK